MSEDYTYFKFKNLFQREWAFEINSNYWKAYSPISSRLVQYQTYDDFPTQHSPECAVPEEQFFEFVVSIASVLPQMDEAQVKLLSGMLGTEPWIEEIRFLLSVRYKSQKRLYYSVSQRRVSGSQELRHDRRYDEVPEYADGDVANAIRLERSSRPLLEKARLYVALRNEKLRDSDAAFQPTLGAWLSDYVKIQMGPASYSNIHNRVNLFDEAWDAIESACEMYWQRHRMEVCVANVGQRMERIAEEATKGEQKVASTADGDDATEERVAEVRGE